MQRDSFFVHRLHDRFVPLARDILGIDKITHLNMVFQFHVLSWPGRIDRAYHGSEEGR